MVARVTSPRAGAADLLVLGIKVLLERLSEQCGQRCGLAGGHDRPGRFHIDSGSEIYRAFPGADLMRKAFRPGGS